MEVNKKFTESLGKEIDNLINKEDVLTDNDKLDRLHKLSSIYLSVAQANFFNTQTLMMEDYKDMMKNVDMKDIDIKGALLKMLGK